MFSWFRHLWNLPTGPWLAAGVIVADTAAAIPFGIADTTPGTGPDPYEWFISILFAVIVVSFLLTMHLPRWRSWTASISGGVWFGTAVGSFVAYSDSLDNKTVIAFILFPLGMSLISFALARVADIEMRVTKIESTGSPS
jgi:hypothetical protein